MKKHISLVIVLCMVLSVFALLSVTSSAAEEAVFIEKGAEWNYYYTTESDVTVAAPSEDWYATSSWATETGNAPFTGSAYAASDANVVFDDSVFSAFMAKTFTVEDASSVGLLTMEIRYDQDPVVYLNGTQVWTTKGYNDKTYVSVSLSDYADLLKDGNNLITVYFHNPAGGGGAVFDMTLYSVGTTDENGNFNPASVTNFGFSNFGGINAPSNILDGDESTCTGSNFRNDVEQGVLFTLAVKDYVDQIFIQCKEEGTTTHEDGTTRGYYSIYAVNGEDETLIAENVPAVTGTNGGYTVTLDEAVEVEAIKVVITSWYGDCWACIADMTVHQGTAPVVTGDATVIVAVLAVVALFGTAVVVVKKVRD